VFTYSGGVENAWGWVSMLVEDHAGNKQAATFRLDDHAGATVTVTVTVKDSFNSVPSGGGTGNPFNWTPPVGEGSGSIEGGLAQAEPASYVLAPHLASYGVEISPSETIELFQGGGAAQEGILQVNLPRLSAGGAVLLELQAGPGVEKIGVTDTGTGAELIFDKNDPAVTLRSWNGSVIWIIELPAAPVGGLSFRAYAGGAWIDFDGELPAEVMPKPAETEPETETESETTTQPDPALPPELPTSPELADATPEQADQQPGEGVTEPAGDQGQPSAKPEAAVASSVDNATKRKSFWQVIVEWVTSVFKALFG